MPTQNPSTTALKPKKRGIPAAVSAEGEAPTDAPSGAQTTSKPKAEKKAPDDSTLFLVKNFDDLADSVLVDAKVVALLFGMSVSHVWRSTRLGNLPKPIRTGPLSTRWRVGAIRTHMQTLARGAE